MKRGLIYLLVILAIGAGLRLYNIRHPYFIGNDAFLHASVIRQALNGGGFANYQLSYGNPIILEPLGFYYITLIPAYVIGLDAAFLIMPLVSGLIAILLAYYLLKDLFNARVGLLTALILALCIAHMYRTSPNSYRGDGFYLTIFLAILYCFNKKKPILTGLLLGLSASLWNGYPIGVLIIISGLLIDATLKFIKNNFTKNDLKNTFYLLITYYFVELGLMMLGIVKQAFFTNNAAFHALITFSPLLLGVIFFKAKKVKKTKILTILIIAGIIILALNVNTINSMINEGLFENSLFYDIGVSELLPPTPELLFSMLSWTLYLMWPGIIILSLMIFKKPKTKHLTYLVWVIISSYLMLSYSRYNFIASITTASMTALFVSYVYNLIVKQNKYIAITLVCLFLIPYTVDSLTNVNRVGPRMSAPWFEALEWMDNNLESGNVITWWDHGSWIQYYTGFPTIADSVTGQDQTRIKRIAQFFTTNKTEDFSDWNAKYLVLGGDVILYSGAVLGIAGTQGYDVQLVSTGTLVQEVMVYPAGNGRFETYAEGTIYRNPEGMIVLDKTFYVNKTGSTTTISDHNVTSGCMVINPYTNLYLNDQACESNYIKLMYGSGLEGYKELYRNNFVIVYELI